MAKYNQKIYKQPSESLLVDMSFTNKLRSGETIVTVNSVVTSPADLVIESQTFNTDGNIVQLLISGGSLTTRVDIEDKEYLVTVVVTTSSNQILENEGIMVLSEKPNR